MIIAADWDGTYPEHPEIHGQTDFIVTGNNWREFDRMMEEWVGEKKPIFFNPIKKDPELVDVINHKANVITKCGVKKFYEDQQVQADILKIMCPDCEIILVKDGSTFI